MRDFGRLYRYEFKKLVSRKTNAITLIICISLYLLTCVMGTFNVDEVDINYAKALDGRAIDQKLLEETVEAYGKIPAGLDNYIISDEYQTYARPYSPIFNYILQHGGMNKSEIVNWDVDENELYRQSREKRMALYDLYRLRDDEIEYWENQVAEKGEPAVFRYAEGWGEILTEHISAGFILMFGITVCLAGIFSEENNKRTDALILSSVHGRTKIYRAKIWAGISLAVLTAVVVSVITIPITLGAFGAGGFSADLDLLYPYPGNISAGEMVIIAELCILVSVVFCGVFAMLLSLCIRNSTASLGCSAAILVLGTMLYMPPKNRALSQISLIFPGTFISQWKITDIKLIEVFGHYFRSYEFVPLLYILLCVLIVISGKFIHEKMQVKSR